MIRNAAILFLGIVVIVICLPAAAVSIGRPPSPRIEPEAEEEPEPAPEPESIKIRFYRTDLDEVVTMDLEEYLVGVVLAEMPSSFEMEALKAQAVAARTYTLKRSRLMGGQGCDNSPEPADICSDSTHCQAWLDPQKKAMDSSAAEADHDLARVRAAVEATAGEVIVYEGHLIEAVYHSTCGGRTESSQAIWSGGPTPYLQDLICPYCSHSPYYRRETLISYETLGEALLKDVAIPAATMAQLPLAVLEETPGGRVGILQVSESKFEGKEIRTLLGLPSTAFTWEHREDGLLFKTRGHGHGVGLCQYGADGAAASGKNYRQILSFYYPGTDIIFTK
jgi:stage II sporulation protein D